MVTFLCLVYFNKNLTPDKYYTVGHSGLISAQFFLALGENQNSTIFRNINRQRHLKYLPFVTNIPFLTKC